MKTLNELEKEFGTVTYSGNIYILLQNAYNDGSDDNYHYTANAVLKGSSVDELGCMDLYVVNWDLTDYAREHMDEIEDESLMCDWDDPSDVSKDHGEGYNPDTGRIC